MHSTLEHGARKRRGGIWRSAGRVVLAVAGVVTALGVLLAQPTCRSNPRSTVRADPERLRAEVTRLSETWTPRSWQHTERDTADRLDYDRMADVVVMVFEALRTLAASTE
jgi:hypothetical protein